MEEETDRQRRRDTETDRDTVRQKETKRYKWRQTDRQTDRPVSYTHLTLPTRSTV